jgi:hypothetical protein
MAQAGSSSWLRPSPNVTLTLNNGTSRKQQLASAIQDRYSDAAERRPDDQGDSDSDADDNQQDVVWVRCAGLHAGPAAKEGPLSSCLTYKVRHLCDTCPLQGVTLAHYKV